MCEIDVPFRRTSDALHQAKLRAYVGTLVISLAFKMLLGNRSSCIGTIFGIFLATLLISQQSAIFLGLVGRSYRIVTDIAEPTMWVMDPSTESEDKLRSVPLSYLDVVRSTPGVQWAVPLSFALLPVVTPSGQFEICQLYGIDDATLIGAPAQMLKGSIHDLRREGGVIVDVFSATGALAKMRQGKKIPLDLGDSLEVNGVRAVVVGICKVTQGFYPQPIIFTSFSQFQRFTPQMTDRMSYILTKTLPDRDVEQVAKAIDANSGLKALTRDEFKDKIRQFFLETGILINFGLSVLLGIIIGFSISGQLFYIMTLDNIKYYALIKAVGGTNAMIFKMILFQAVLVGIIGYVLGTSITILWGMAIKDTTLAFAFPWELLVFSATIVLVICFSTVLLCLKKVMHADPKILLGN